MYEGLIAETVTITGHGGDEIGAYLARPLGAGPFPGVLVIHHAPGWDEATKEIARRFAHHGYVAISPNLYHRFGPELAPDDAAAAARAGGWITTDQFLGDAGGALTSLRGLPISSGKVGTIGYCSGGRQSFLCACELPIDAAVDCYGAFVISAAPPELPYRMEPVIDRAPKITCPILGLFGVEDRNPAPAEVTQLDAELTRLGKEHEFHTFEDAGHGFFATDRPAYRVAAAVEGWRLVFDFYARHLQ
ncbi:MAG TPA: dienelactone hydrolase family protein [Candidatus Acidoferrales bacterium]|nr:dienelactone hydrolase family protein [Candidatus Acidoferrales bacterium]